MLMKDNNHEAVIFHKVSPFSLVNSRDEDHENKNSTVTILSSQLLQ